MMRTLNGWGLPASTLLAVALVCITSSVRASESAHFYSYVNWEYSHRNDLIGWKNTSRLIEHSVASWGYSAKKASLDNGGARALNQFQARIINEKSSQLKLIYFASHQTPSGRFDFPDKTKEHWGRVFKAHTKSDGSPCIFILDACHADIVPIREMGNMNPFDYMLTAAAPHEETYELRMFSRRPVDFKRRYQAEVTWMNSALGPEWKGEVSFLGFIWVRQFLKTPHRPVTYTDWETFLTGMEQEARRFARERSRYLSSTIRVWK